MDKLLLSARDTEQAGVDYAESLLESEFVDRILARKTAWVIFLEGELGVGKTTWVQGFLKQLGYTGRVKSPSYSLVEWYDPAELNWQLPVFHFDFYRLSENLNLDLSNFSDIGLWEALEHPGVCVIEWASRIHEGLLAPDLEIQIVYDLESGGRILRTKRHQNEN